MGGANGSPPREGPETADVSANKLRRLVDNDQAHLIPSWIWFASSAFPMVAGTLGPVASAFSVCALVRPWRQSLPPGTDIREAQYIRDPAWLTAINAIQLAIALVANASLLLNMAHRVRFTVAQPLTIVGWYLSSFCLIALSATASGPLLVNPPETHVWSQAFYYGIYAAILYFIVASLMTVTFLGAYAGYYAKDFMLNTSQRTLMLQTIMFLAYLLLGALVFSSIEGWTYLDGLYWADISLFTVGFGDIAVQTTLGRALLFPYTLIGVISLGLVIDAIRRLILDRGRRKLDARIVETKRQSQLRRMDKEGASDVLEPIRPSAAEDGSSAPGSGTAVLTEFERREEEFKLMRRIQRQAAQRRKWRALAMSTSTWLILWLVGAKIFQNCEEPYQHWSYFDAFYLCFVSLITIGYGDVTPISNSGKSFFVFWSLMALPTMTVMISHAGDTVVKGVRDATNRLGTITILPGEESFKDALKAVIRSLSCGKFYHPKDTDSDDYNDDDDDDDDDDGHASDCLDTADAGGGGDPGDKGAGREQGRGSVQDRVGSDPEKYGSDPAIAASSTSSAQRSARHSPNNTSDSNQGGTRRAASRGAVPRRSFASPRGAYRRSMSIIRENLATEVAASRAGYRLMLIEEISQVVKHIKENPPREYKFPQWAWYLKLVGEDEDNYALHRKPRASNYKKHRWGGNRQDKAEPGDPKTGDDEFDGRPQWSWLGSRSPLMGSQEEAEWVLERLIHKLTEELREAAENEASERQQ